MTKNRGLPRPKKLAKTLLDRIHDSFPILSDVLADHPLMDDTLLQELLTRLLTANAPTTGCALPGGMIEPLRACAEILDLPPVSSSLSMGNATLTIVDGETLQDVMDMDAPDLIITAHMDRPTFKIRNAERGELYPICAVRFPVQNGEYRAPAKAMRWKSGKLQVGARGTLVYTQAADGGESFRFEGENPGAKLLPFDLITLDVQPTFADNMVRGTGLDNVLGMITALGVAHTFGAMRGMMGDEMPPYSVAFGFTDEEEGIPSAFFGRGASRLLNVIPIPVLGVVSVDAQTENDDSPRVGKGGSFGHVSAWGRGAVVPPNVVALADDLTEILEKDYSPATMQMNTGYLSRSDDMGLTRIVPVLGMFGPPMRHPHTAEEEASLFDIQAAIAGLSYYVAALLSPKLQDKYHIVEEMPGMSIEQISAMMDMIQGFPFEDEDGGGGGDGGDDEPPPLNPGNLRLLPRR